MAWAWPIAGSGRTCAAQSELPRVNLKAVVASAEEKEPEVQGMPNQ
jgi:hypothetical protein